MKILIFSAAHVAWLEKSVVGSDCVLACENKLQPYIDGQFIKS